MVVNKDIQLFKDSYIKAASKTNCFKKAVVNCEDKLITVLLLDEDNNKYSIQKANKKELRSFKSIDSARNTLERFGFMTFKINIIKVEV